MAPNLKPDAPTFCVICSQPEGDDAEAVECEACRLWARLGCAGVSGKDEVFCPYCTQSQVPKMRKNARKPDSDAGTIVGAAKLPKDVQDQQELKRVEQERKTAELISNRREEMEKMFREKQLRAEKELQERELAAANELRALKLKLEKEFQDKKRTAEHEFLLKQEEIRKLISKSKPQIEKISLSGSYGLLKEEEKALLAGEYEVDVIGIDEMKFDSDMEEESRRKSAEMIEKGKVEESLEMLEVVRIVHSPEYEKLVEGSEEEAPAPEHEVEIEISEKNEEGMKTPELGKDKVSDGPGKPVKKPSNDEDSPVNRRPGRNSTASFDSSQSPSPQKQQKDKSSLGNAVYDGGGTSPDRRRIVSSSEKKFVEEQRAKRVLEMTTTRAGERFETSDEERGQKWLGKKEEEWRRSEEKSSKQWEKEHADERCIESEKQQTILEKQQAKEEEIERKLVEEKERVQCGEKEERAGGGGVWRERHAETAVALVATSADGVWQPSGCEGHGTDADRPPRGRDDRKPGESERRRDGSVDDDENDRPQPVRLRDCEDCGRGPIWRSDLMRDGVRGGPGEMRRNGRDWIHRRDGDGAQRCDFGFGGDRRDDRRDDFGGMSRDEGNREGDMWRRTPQKERHGGSGSGEKSSWRWRNHQAVRTRPLKTGDLVYIIEGKNRKSWFRGVVQKSIVSGDARIRQAWVRTCSGLVKRARQRDTPRSKVNLIQKQLPNQVYGPGNVAATHCRDGVDTMQQQLLLRGEQHRDMNSLRVSREELARRKKKRR